MGVASCDKGVVCDSSEGVTRGWENETDGCGLRVEDVKV